MGVNFYLIYLKKRKIIFLKILVLINSDDDCWSNENTNIIQKDYAHLIKFSPNITYGQHSCSLQINSPWLPNIQNGFGIFLPGEMYCSSTLIINCLTDRIEDFSAHFTCHTSNNKIQIPCNSISLTYKTNIKIQETKKTTFVQVVALAKGTIFEKKLKF
jgi:hypothetical protein